MPGNPAVVMVLALSACGGDAGKDAETTDTGAATDTGTPDTGTPGTPDDADGDGSPDDLDCDDADPTVYPGAPDPCGDDRVTDCDRTTDDQRVTVDGVATFDDLATAIAAASAGSVVTVCRGTWAGPLTSLVPVDLVAHHGPEETVLDGADAGTTLALPGGSTVTGFTLTGGRVDGDGGGLAMTSAGSLAVTRCVLEGNRATRGGGLSLAEGAQVTVTGTEIRGNEAEGGGGVLVPSGATLDLADSVVSGNLASRYGGGVFLTDGVLIGGVVTGNDAPYPVPVDGQPMGGGGVSLFAAGEVVGTDIGANTGGVGAGVSAAHGTFLLTDVRVHDNETPSGTTGGAFVYYAEVTLAGTSEIVDNRSPDASIGGLSVDSGTVIGGRVARNSAAYRCGGVYATYAALQDVIIEENTAEEMAGVCVGAGVVLLGGRIAGNVAAGVGGGLGPIGGPGTSAELAGVEVADNQATQGAGLYLDGTQLTVRASQVVRNVASDGGGGAAVVGDGVLASDGSDWGAGADDNTPGDVLAGVEYVGWGAGATFSCTEAACAPSP